MKIIEYIDHQDYQNCTKIFKRKAVRAIIIKDDKLAMIQSAKYGELKFPGGGQNPNESDMETLKRELREETGLDLKEDDITPYGMTYEIRKSVFEDHTIFEMTSIYYLCEAHETLGEINLDPYEKDYGYQLVYVDIDDAIHTNHTLILELKEKVKKFIPWTERELVVLKDLKRHRGL